jgi:hypothetical protein
MKKAVLIVLVLMLSAMTGLSAQQAADLKSGWYRVDTNAYGNEYPAMWLLLVNKGAISGQSFWGGDGFHKLSGTISGATVTVTRSWTEGTQTKQQVYTGTISGQAITGTFSADPSAGGNGTWKLYLQ